MQEGRRATNVLTDKQTLVEPWGNGASGRVRDADQGDAEGVGGVTVDRVEDRLQQEKLGREGVKHEGVNCEAEIGLEEVQ